MDSNIKQESYPYRPPNEHDESAPPKRRPRHRLSCAECRRLKLKCDRVWPCGSCTKRGCARICPEGTLQAKVRSKDTSVLLAKISELENLLHQKDQLLLAQESHQAQQLPHRQVDQPTGTQFLNSTDFLPALPGIFSNGLSNVQDNALPSLIDVMGTLNLSGDGRARYLGSSASSAYLDEDCSDSESVSSTPGTSEDPDESSGFGGPRPGSALFTRPPAQRFDINHLKSFLPDKSGAERLGDAYYNFVSHLYGLLNRSELTSLIEEVYGDQGDGLCLTRLALLYATFALGVLFDPGVQALNPEARQWHEACETCLMSTDFLTNPTLSAIQSLHMMGIYLLNTRIDAAETFWPILGIAMRLCQSMGLHRDGSNWGLESSELDQRRRTFHEILSLDRLQSLVLGRPYAISEKHYDTHVPEPEEILNDEQGNVSPLSFWVYKWRFSTYIGRVVDDVFSVATPSLTVINRLDQEIRKFDGDLPASIRFTAIPSIANGPSYNVTSLDATFRCDGSPSLQLIMQQHCMAVLENQTLLFLHRRAFALALSESPSEPLQSLLASSVISVILESSRNLIAIAKAAQDVYPDIAHRWWYLFFHAYSGATCVASLLITSPNCMLNKHAWTTWRATITVFETAATHTPLCRDFLARLNRLNSHALSALNAYKSGQPLPKPRRLSNLSSTRRSLRPLSLSGCHDEGSTPLAHYLESYGASTSQSDSGADDLPCDLGASTRLTRKSRRQSMSNSSAASGRVPSASSSSRSRGTSFGSATTNDRSPNGTHSLTQHAINNLGCHNLPNHNNGPNVTLAASFNSRSWGLVSSPNDFDDEECPSLNNPNYWENLSIEPDSQAYNPMFTVPHSQPTHSGYFSGFNEHFHPPMALPSNELSLTSPNGVANAYNTMFGPSYESPRLQPLPPSTTTSPPLLNLSSLSRNTGLNQNTGVDGNPSSSNAQGNDSMTSPTGTQFDLLDTFLTWQSYDQ
ncbi:fungal-specific transcription factor domain-containing protein [Melampsora americana]|nr:fungal-specific transcription factor domain-containing protein [Melampsora americana]